MWSPHLPKWWSPLKGSKYSRRQSVVWGGWLACNAVEFSRHLLFTSSDIQCGCHLLQYQDYSLKSPETSQLPQNIWCLASAVKCFTPKPLFQLCSGFAGGGVEIADSTSKPAVPLDVPCIYWETLVQLTTCFSVFVQSTWIYGCCGNYNWISWLQCRPKPLHRVTWSRWEWGRAVDLVLALGMVRRLVLCACWS